MMTELEQSGIGLQSLTLRSGEQRLEVVFQEPSPQCGSNIVRDAAFGGARKRHLHSSRVYSCFLVVMVSVKLDSSQLRP